MGGGGVLTNFFPFSFPVKDDIMVNCTTKTFQHVRNIELIPDVLRVCRV
jgi:hypothetical protein